jgi:hypothetical protein
VPPAAAQLALAPGEQRDLDFARGLIEAKYEDLAEDFLGRLEKGGKLSKEGAAQMMLVRVQLLESTASDAKELDRKLALLAEAADSLQTFLKSHEDHPSAPLARVKVGDNLRQRAEFLLDAVKTESDAAKLAKYKADGLEVAKQAKAYFVRLRDETQRRVDMASTQGNTDALENAEAELVESIFQIPRMDYLRALFLPKGDSQRQVLLDGAFADFDQFIFDWGDRPFALDAQLVQGLVEKEKGNLDKALERIEIVWEETRDSVANPGQGNWDPEQVQVVYATATLEKARVLLAGKKPADAAKDLEEAFQLLPDLLGSELGWQLKFEQGLALRGAGAEEAASKAFQLVAANARDTRMAARAIEQLGTAGVTDTSELTAEGQLRAAQGLLKQNDIDGAILGVHRAIARARAAGKLEGVIAEGFFSLGIIYKDTGRPDEALVAYRAVSDGFPTHPLAPRCLRNEMVTILAMNANGRSQALEKEYLAALKRLTEKYPNSPEVKDIQLDAAKRLEDRKQFAEALAEYEKIPADSPSYGDGQYGAGRCWVEEGRRLWTAGQQDEGKKAFDRALAAYANAVAWAEKEKDRTIDAQALLKAQDVRFWSRVLAAQILLHESQKNPKKALEEAAALEKEVEDGDAKKLGALVPIQLQALVQSGQTEAAAAKLDQLLEKKVASSAVTSEARKLATLFDREATAALQKDPRDLRADKKLRQAARYYAASVETHAAGERRGTVEELLPTADRIVVIGLLLNGVPEGEETAIALGERKIADRSFWERAIPIYETLVGPRYRDAVGENRPRLIYKLGTAYAVLDRWDALIREYERLVRDEGFLKADGSINPKKAGERPELLLAYLDLGYAYEKTAKGAAERWNLAIEVYVKLIRALPVGDSRWWQANYHYLVSLVEKGSYDEADVYLRKIERENPELDQNQYGMRDKFRALKQRIAARLPAGGAAAPAESEPAGSARADAESSAAESGKKPKKDHR